MTVFRGVVTTHLLLFLVSLSFPQPELKKFIRPSYIEKAEVPFASKYIYADKTKQALELLDGDDVGETYFFVRPRRFGKSTFLRTLQRIFDGSKHIFEGTHIYQSDYNWVPYPILYLDLGDTKEKYCHNVMISNRTRLVEAMQLQLENFIKIYKLPYNLNKSNDVVSEFVNILLNVREQSGNSTVVLVDEYDLPVLSNMKDCLAAAMINKNHLEDLLQRLKTWSGNIKFAFVTGVSRAVFRMFISPPDLTDITDDPKFHEIAGITDSDLNTVYADHVANIAERRKESNVTGILKHWYDGYQFADGIDSRLYSPLSVHGYFRSGGVAKPYYDDKGYAEFIFDQMVKRPDDFSNLNLNVPVSSNLKGGKSLDTTRPAVLLYDAGYLTIQNIKDGQYYLGFPNKEMERAFYTDIADAAMESENGTGIEVEQIRTALGKPIPNFRVFINAINSGIAKLGMRAPFEEWYDWQTMLFMRYAGIDAERQSDIPIVPSASNDYKNTKKVDVTGYNDDTFFLFEVKFERHGCSEAWNDAKQSIQAHLDRNKKEEKPLNILAAGITFTADRTKKPVMSYKAKLFAPNGTVLKTYFSNTRIKSDPKSDESFVAEEMST